MGVGGAPSRACVNLPGEVRQASQSDTELRRGRRSLLGCRGGKGTPDRGNSMCRGSEAGKHLACSRKSTWSGMAGGSGACFRGGAEVRHEAGEADAWDPFSLFSHKRCLQDFFPCVSYNMGLDHVPAVPSARSPAPCSAGEIPLIFQGPALMNS